MVLPDGQITKHIAVANLTKHIVATNLMCLTAYFVGPLLHGRPLLTNDLLILQSVIDTEPFVVQICSLGNGNI